MFPIPTAKNGICACRKGKKCSKPAKHPWYKGWQESALEYALEEMRKVCDPANGKIGVVRNMGIRTGTAITPGFKLVVVEGDSEEACRWIESFGVSGTRIAVSRRGHHFYLLVPEDVEVHNATDLVPDVDVRGEGGFVVAPGSVHFTGHIYRWKNEAPVMPIPEALLEYILDRQKTTNKTADGIVKGYVQEGIPFGKIKKGTRHDVLLRVAASFRSRGYDEEKLSSSLREINEGACEEPLPSQEINEIVEYALILEPKHSPVPDEDLELLNAFREGYEVFPFMRPLTVSDRAILLSSVDQGTVVGAGTVDGVKVPISRRVLAEKAGLPERTVERRIKVLTDLGFIRIGKDSNRRQDSGFIVLKNVVADPETGEAVFDARDFLTKCQHDKRRSRGVVTPTIPPLTSYRADKTLKNLSPDLVMSLRNGSGRLGKTSGRVLDAVLPLLEAAERPLRPREIAPALGIDPKDARRMSTLYGSLRRLREKGVVEKKNGGYRLTPKAKKVIEDDLEESQEIGEKQAEKHEKEREMHSHLLDLWRAERDGKNLEDVPVPDGLRKLEGLKVLARAHAIKENLLSRDPYEGFINLVANLNGVPVEDISSLAFYRRHSRERRYRTGYVLREDLQAAWYKVAEQPARKG